MVLLFIPLIFSCNNKKGREEDMYHESLERQYNDKQEELSDYYKNHDSLARIDSFKKVSLASLDTIILKVHEIRASAVYQDSNLPKKLEYNLIRIEESTNDLRSKIRNPRNAEKNRSKYEAEIQKEIKKLKDNLNQFK